jgi:cytochrome c oxidase subunit 3
MSLIKTLMSKPWLESGSLRDYPDEPRASNEPTAMVGLFTFLCVATSVFGLFIVSYNFRMELPDWVSMSKPGLLWFNTLLLILSSVAFQGARNASATDNMRQVRFGMITGGLTSMMFVAGQFIAWRQLIDAGVFTQKNPASEFYFLITALHALHVLGGLFVWGKTVWRMLGGQDVQLSVDLCTVYWHYLLVVWIVLFGLLLST